MATERETAPPPANYVDRFGLRDTLEVAPDSQRALKALRDRIVAELYAEIEVQP